MITEFILRGEENCKRSVQFGFHHRTERTMEDFKRDILLKVIGFDVLTEFVLNDIINMCSELEKRLHHRDPVDRTVFDIYNGIKLLARSRIEEKIFETEIESQTSYESKRDLLQQALARPSSTTFLQKFIQNKSTEMCKSIESELSEDSLSKAEKSRFESLLGDFMSLQMSLPELIDLPQMNARDFKDIHTYLSCCNMNTSEDIDVCLKTVDRLIGNIKEKLSVMSERKKKN